MKKLKKRWKNKFISIGMQKFYLYEEMSQSELSRLPYHMVEEVEPFKEVKPKKTVAEETVAKKPAKTVAKKPAKTVAKKPAKTEEDK